MQALLLQRAKMHPQFHFLRGHCFAQATRNFVGQEFPHPTAKLCFAVTLPRGGGMGNPQWGISSQRNRRNEPPVIFFLAMCGAAIGVEALFIGISVEAEIEEGADAGFLHAE